MLTVHRSNHLESLADALSRELRERPQPPLTPEVVVVQSLGARRWLSFALAQRLGVAANLEFPFPAALVERAFNALVPRGRVSPIFRREVLPWRIHALLPELWDQPEFAELRAYAAKDPVKLWQLAGQIAAVFDRYLAYRPHLLRGWDAGDEHPEQRWQSRLWRKLAMGNYHPAALAERAEKAPATANAALPARISVFGLSTLAPFHLELLGELGRRVDVHLYVLSPTKEYWGDLRGEKEQRRYQRWRSQRGHGTTKEEEGAAHPLLASLGKIGRHFHEATLDLTPGHEPTYYEEPKSRGMLGDLQRGILHLTTPEPGDAIAFDQADRSIQVHNCHSPLRELEVLHDQLLAHFEADASLEPRDVLVSVPDIAAYAPFIDAVFGAPETESTRFPYSIADRDAGAQNGVADAMLRVLDLVGSRYAATAVISILECPPISERFGLKAGDLSLARRWIAESGTRWGLDGEHRGRLGFPNWEENSWKFGLDRLLLGFALPATERDLFEGILPEGDVEGALAETLGRLATFCSTLFRITESLARAPQAPAEWALHLASALDELCASDGDFADSWHQAAQAIEAMAENAELADNRSAIPFGVARDYLIQAFGTLDRGSEFLRGGITFCSLKPMRAVPHRIIALLGLNDSAFPRATRPPSFDLTAAEPKPGDRTARDDDRYLFLENILSARDVLFLSYCGQSAKDDSESPPSVIVVELLDHLSATHRSPDDRPLREHLTTVHPLQPFDRAYFDSADPRLFSYSREAAQAARVAAGNRIPAPAFITAPLQGREIERDLTVDQLAAFFAHPTKVFAQEVLGMRQPFEEASPEDVEPMELDNLEIYSIRQELAEAALDGEDPNQLFPITRAKGTLPHGPAGDIIFSDAAADAREIAQRVATLAPGPALPDQFATARVGEWEMRGCISEQHGDCLVRVRPGSVSPKELVRAWCHHLFACAAEPDANYHTLIVGRDLTCRLQTVQTAAAELEKLLKLYAEGQTRPLPFFPATSEAFASAVVGPKAKSAEDAIPAAEREWRSSPNKNGESEDGWNRVIWRSPAEPLGEEWRQLAIDVFSPLVAHLTKEKV